ncbi:hypothetical protein, partial [Alkalibaculum bacchi]|uniref:hypothetical protein n=1 Tax=Alkalibaculum bacchi TaxID=645887 RepID=UPI0026EDE418
MADTFIYDGPTQQVTDLGVAFTVRDGQYLFMTGFNPSNGHNTFVTYCGPGNEYKVTFVINTYWAPNINRDNKYGIGSGGGYFQHISRFNWDKWGTKWKHAASGGCMYTIRKACKLVDSDAVVVKVVVTNNKFFMTLFL